MHRGTLKQSQLLKKVQGHVVFIFLPQLRTIVSLHVFESAIRLVAAKLWNILEARMLYDKPCRVGSVGSVPASRTVGREFASRPGHTKDHHKNGTNCLPA